MIETLVTSASLTVRQACAALEVSESGYYAHRHKAQRLRRQQDVHIAQEMKQIFEQNFHCYGSPRLVKALRKRGISCGKTRIRRLMQQEGISPRQKRRFRPCTTQSNPHLPCAPNVIAALPPATAPAQRFHSDITYIPTKEGFLFLAATLDAVTGCVHAALRGLVKTLVVRQRQYGDSTRQRRRSHGLWHWHHHRACASL